MFTIKLNYNFFQGNACKPSAVVAGNEIVEWFDSQTAVAPRSTCLSVPYSTFSKLAPGCAAHAECQDSRPTSSFKQHKEYNEVLASN